MQDGFDVPLSDCLKLALPIEFPTCEREPFRFGFNPLARGYRAAVARRRAILIVACVAVAIISASLWACGRLPPWQAVLGIAGPVLPLAAIEWSWRRSRFCKSCGVCTKGPRDARGLVWCPACHSLTDPARVTVEPVGQNVTDSGKC